MTHNTKRTVYVPQNTDIHFFSIAFSLILMLNHFVSLNYSLPVHLFSVTIRDSQIFNSFLNISLCLICDPGCFI